MKRSALVLAIVFCFFLVLSPPGRVHAKENWVSVRSKNFFLLGNASEKDIRQVGTRLEQFREVFSQLFPRANVNSAVPTTVIVFKSDSSYRPFKVNATNAGYFQPGPDVNYITLTTEVRGEQDRSEERRVGKECRSRCYAYHQKEYGEQCIKFMKDGVNATPLPTVNTTGNIYHA